MTFLLNRWYTFVNYYEIDGDDMKRLLENYSTFRLMVLTSTLLGNAKTEMWTQSASQLIRWIGEAFRLSDNDIHHCQEVVIDKLSAVQTIDDANLNYGQVPMESVDIDAEIIFKIKSDAIRFLHEQGTQDAPNWPNYHHANLFHPVVHFTHLHDASRTGNLVACRHVGLLFALGIGCEQSLEKAALRFKQAAYWGDLWSMTLLSRVYELMDNPEATETYRQLAMLCDKHLNSGTTVLSDQMKKDYGAKAQLEYVYVSSIFQDIVRVNQQNHGYIDYSFLEVMFMDAVPYREKMGFINNYLEYKWRDVSNTSNQPTMRIGF